jgi:hypothetical protein
MGCEKSKAEDPNVFETATPEQEQVWAKAQRQAEEIVLDCQLRLEITEDVDEDAASAWAFSMRGPGALRWFKMEALAAKTSQKNDGHPASRESLKEDYMISNHEGESRLQLMNSQRSTSNRNGKYNLLRANGNGETTLLYSIARPSTSVNNPEVAIQAQSPGKELPQVRYVCGSTANSFSLHQEGKLACHVSKTSTRDGQRSSCSRYSVTIEPGMDVLLHVGLVCASLVVGDGPEGQRRCSRPDKKVPTSQSSVRSVEL